MINLLDLTRPALSELLAHWGYTHYHADRVWEYLYRKQVTSIVEMTALRAELQTKLLAEATLSHLPVRQEQASSDGLTHKFLLALNDGQVIETVLMGHQSSREARHTVCISTQAGCAMGCVFCATGQMGFRRHLSSGEIVAQVLHVTRRLKAHGEKLRNIVFMGMGEPLHNYDATMTAIKTLLDPKGLALAPRHITVSTVGVVPGILRLAAEKQPLHLAVSLHAATDTERTALVPVNKRWPLTDLIAACQTYIEQRQRRIFFEWALIEGKNDGAEQAHAVGRLLKPLVPQAHVNLIPLNPTPGYHGHPTEMKAVRQFQAILATYDLPSTIRQRRGIDIAAGCGQLAGAEEN